MSFSGADPGFCKMGKNPKKKDFVMNMKRAFLMGWVSKVGMGELYSLKSATGTINNTSLIKFKPID